MEAEPSTLPEGSYVMLPKGWPLRIVDVYSAYRKMTFKKTKDCPSGSEDERNSIQAEVELELPFVLAESLRMNVPFGLPESLRMKDPKVKAIYCWSPEGGTFHTRTFVSPYLRRAPWEPASVPVKRYVGVMGNEYPEPGQQNGAHTP